jgi:hypothetical protein
MLVLEQRWRDIMTDRKSRVIDDDSPVTRTFDKNDFTPHWGKNTLDRNREPFTEEERHIANRIGLPNTDQT